VRTAFLQHAHYRRCSSLRNEQGVKEEDAIKRGLEEKAAEFTKAGEFYQKV